MTRILDLAPTRRFSRPLQLVAATSLVLLACGAAARAQSIASATLNGTVTDRTGGAVPGVTVALTSPALQVGQMVTVTGSDGTYRFVDLPAGLYNARFELTGFKPVIREGLRLTVGFVARIDAVLELGGIEEAVTVSGQSPVVDVTSTSASVAFTRETLEAVPRGRDLQNVFAMAPGVTQPIPDVGGSNMANRVNISSYGVAAQPKLQVEGMNVTLGADQSAGVYFMDNTLEDVQIKTSGADAVVSVPGISFVMSMYAELVFLACSRLIRIQPGPLKESAWLTLQPSVAAAPQLLAPPSVKKPRRICLANSRCFAVA